MTPEVEAHIRQVVGDSGTSFRLGMQVLARPARLAMYAVYAFCREIDDIADQPGEEAAKRAALDAWAEEIDAIWRGTPKRMTTAALSEAVAAYDLPQAEFAALIAGMRMDIDLDFARTDRLDRAGLRLYCRRVAGTVGILSVTILGAPEATRFALMMGEALQLINILRDLGEDAALGRLYLPMDMVRGAGISASAPPEIIRDPRIGAVCRTLAGEAGGLYRETGMLIRGHGHRHLRRHLRPALMMGAVYHGYLERLEARGFDNPTAPVTLSQWVKIARALRAYIR